MADGGGHSTDLPVLALPKFQSDPAIGNVPADTDRRDSRRHLGLWFKDPGLAGARFVSLYDQPGCKFFQCFRRRDPLHLCPVAANMAMLGFQQLRIQTGFVTQQQETL